MQTTLKELPDSRVEVQAEVEPKDVERAANRTARAMARELRLPGFRKGKAPPNLVIQRMGFAAVLSEAIREALSLLVRGRTVIAIAHRLSTLRNFDRVVMLQGGQILEDGPPDVLVRGRGPYRELVTREMGRLAVHAA